MGSQMGKTDGIVLNPIGARLADDPVPIIYIGPSRNFVETMLEPRLVSMFKGCRDLWRGLLKGKKERLTRKIVNGVKVRLGWAGSASELAGDPACKVFIDERDRMKSDVGGEGDPKKLADARHRSYPDGQTIVVSTPLIGQVEVEYDEETRLWRWKVSDNIESPTWKLWQEGTRHEWAWPCPECGDYFIPRFRLLWWPKDATPEIAFHEARLTCPHCGSQISDDHRDRMNARGRFVAPGQRITKEGEVIGPAPFSLTVSFWVSGLCSPWVTWGKHAYDWLEAVRGGDPETIQGVVNTGFGELYSVSRDAPKEEAIKALRLPYRSGAHVPGVQWVTIGVDVQGDRLVYAIRGWGADLESWLLEAGEVMGSTESEKEGAWRDFAMMRDRFFCGLPILRAFIDSGYRTSTVYAFCRRSGGWAFPTKGRDTMDKPISRTPIDTTPSGKVLKNGFAVWNVNTDYFKRWLHERFQRDPDLPGGFHLPEDVSEDYMKQMTSEARVTKPSGAFVWVRVRENHFFDAEALNVAAAHSLHLQLRTTGTGTLPPAPASKPQPQDAPQTDRGADPFADGGGYFDSTRRE